MIIYGVYRMSYGLNDRGCESR